MPVSRRTTEAYKATERQKEAERRKSRRRPVSYEQYGSKQETAPYLEVSLGRHVVDGQLHEITQRIGKRAGLTALQPLALILVPGHEIAQKTNFGLLVPGKPRLAPEKVIELLITKMRDPKLNPAKRLAESSADSLSVEVEGIVPRKWSKAHRAAAKIVDVATTDYPTSGQLYGEKAAVLQRLGNRVHDISKPLENIDHFIHFAEVNVQALPSFQAAGFIELARGNIDILLGPLEPIQTPKSAD
ncbi:hypothetical protein H0X10_01170 [Candidatus Saccharibacteria bacterium]|nr:hypothetical protein [Candidatus Saccharibacteria bacterium]